jgi:ribosomal protein L34
MFRLHVVLDNSRTWVDYAPAWVTAVAALVTVFVAILIARNQNKLQETLAKKQTDLQEAQLKKDLFDRRFIVFTDTLDFIGMVIRNDGDIVLEGPEYRHFLETTQKAGMLFGADVRSYLKGVTETTTNLYVSARGRGRAIQSFRLVQIENCNLASVRVLFSPVGRFMNEDSASLSVKDDGAAASRRKRILSNRRAKDRWRITDLLIPSGRKVARRRRNAITGHHGERGGN